MNRNNWTDSPRSAAARRLLNDVHRAKSFGELDETLRIAQALFARQAMQEWELEGIGKFARFRRDFLGAEMAQGRSPEAQARRVESRNSKAIVHKVVTSYLTAPLPGSLDIKGFRRRV